MNKFELYYFSGTGNSLHIAKEIKKKIPDVILIPIISLLKKDKIKTNAEVVGIIFPLYLTTLPIPIAKFMKKIDINSAQYAFSVITRVGTFSVANVYIEKILKKSGKVLDASFMVNMANNTPAGLKPFADQKWAEKMTKEKLDSIEEKVQENVNFIVDCILKKEKIHSKSSTSRVSHFIEPLMTKLNQKPNEIPFIADTTCTKCGICEKVCMSGKIKIVDEKVVWDKSVQCYYCYSCFNYCPTQSVLVNKKYMLKNGRYHHFDVDYKEISSQRFGENEYHK